MRRSAVIFSLALMLWLVTPLLWFAAWMNIWQFTAGYTTSRPTVIGMWVDRREGSVILDSASSATADYPTIGSRNRYAVPGVELRSQTLQHGRSDWLLLVRVWVVEVALSPLVIFSFVILRRAQRKTSRLRAGHCVQCGYDLQHSSGRCPECGIEAVAPVA